MGTTITPTREAMDATVLRHHHLAIVALAAAHFNGDLAAVTEAFEDVYGGAGDYAYVHLADEGMMSNFQDNLGGKDIRARGPRFNAFKDLVGKIHIFTPLSADGRLPTIQVGGMKLDLLGPGDEFEGGVVPDIRPNLFGINWVNKTLAHPEQSDVMWRGIRIPITETKFEERGVHQMWLDAIANAGGDYPVTVMELAIELFHGQLKDRFNSDPDYVVTAIADPGPFHFRAATCQQVARRARDAWRSCHNPFVEVIGGARPAAPVASAPAVSSEGPLVVDREIVQRLYEMALRWNAVHPSRRSLLLVNIPQAVTASLPAGGNPADQTKLDITTLAGFQAGTGGMMDRPIKVWMQNLLNMSEFYPDTHELKDLIARV